jgi:cellulose synthase/poly-beta-1,6-N-acetylglucosamine synthase-like glycosyltransferase
VLDLLLIPIAVAYLAILTALFVFGLNFAHLTWLATRQPVAPASRQPDPWPVVTVQLPIFNELYVAPRLIDAVGAFDYPAHLLEIQVLDDSTDETSGVIAACVAEQRAAGRAITHLRRGGRRGYKAGALAHGLDSAHGEFIAIFDADFVPPRDFLRQMVPVLVADPGLAFAQARWGHTNRDYSLVTSLQALAIDAHFAVEQYGRWRAGYWFNFNGTAGVWRRAALDDAGGWTNDTLTEDLDVSYRAALRGWRAAFVPSVEAPAEIPASFSAYRRQQHRWARGSFECAIKHLPTVWRSAATRRRKLQATLHLTGYSIHLMLLSLAFLYPMLLLLSVHYPRILTLFGVMAAFNLTALAPTLLFATAQRNLGRRWWPQLPRVLLLSVFGAGMMLNTTRAAIQAVRRRPAAFERTPKHGIRQRHEDWRGLRYQLRVDPIVTIEVLLGAANLVTLVAAIERGAWAVALYAAVFASGLLLTGSLSIAQRVRRQPALHVDAPLLDASQPAASPHG